jgi:hypothetical protein
LTPRKRKRGRPPLREGERSLTIGVKVTESDYDSICTVARRLDVSLAEVVRKAGGMGASPALDSLRKSLSELREMVLELKRQVDPLVNPEPPDPEIMRSFMRRITEITIRNAS